MNNTVSDIHLFEAARWEAEALPIAIRRFSLGDYATLEEAKEALRGQNPSFRLGSENEWLMERTFVYDGQEIVIEATDAEPEDNPYVRLIKRQRRGWYLIPNPIHNGVVIVPPCSSCITHLALSSFGDCSVGSPVCPAHLCPTACIAHHCYNAYH